jgi:hypothetical protein
MIHVLNDIWCLSFATVVEAREEMIVILYKFVLKWLGRVAAISYRDSNPGPNILSPAIWNKNKFFLPFFRPLP